MGRPGAGSKGSVSSSSGSMHRTGTGSSGSMHRVGGNTIRPSSTSKSSSSVFTSSLKSNTSRPAATTLSSPKRPTSNIPSRPVMDLSSNMTGRSNKNEQAVRKSADVRKSSYDSSDRRVNNARNVYDDYRSASVKPRHMPPLPPPKSEYQRRTEQRIVSALEPVIIAKELSKKQRSTTINNTYVNVDGRRETVRKESNVHYSSSGLNDNSSYGRSVQANRGSTLSEKGKTMKKQNNVKAIVVITVFIIMFTIVVSLIAKSSGGQDTSYNRTKLDTGFAYMNNCVDDELGWLNTNKVSKGIRKFYDITGAQPYIWLRAYDGTTYSEDEQFKIATNYFDDTVSRQDAVMFVYFEDADPNVVGDMAIIYGVQSGKIMDAEAEDIFWNYVDADWESYSEDETDEMFIDIFVSTANTIMYHKTNGWDVLRRLMVLCCIGAVVCAIIVFFKEKNRRDKEKAEETERILKASLNDLASEKEDELLNKYK